MANVKSSSLLLIVALIAATGFVLLVDGRPLRSGSTNQSHPINNGSALAEKPETAAASPTSDSDIHQSGGGGGGVVFTLVSGPSRKGAGH
ncbi:hypothetical protein SDJN03_11560, partial [Cucurbita argyrosperma subsp. sororia]